MKRVLYLIISLIMLTTLINNVYASSYELTFDGNSEFSDEVTINLQVSNLTDFPNGFYGLESTLVYDKTKIELTEITGLSDFEVTYDKTVSDKFVAYVANGIEAGTKILAIKFKNIGLTNNETTEISLTNLLASDGDNDIKGSNISKVLKLVKQSYIKGDLNKNGKIDLPDIIYLLKRYLGIEETTSTDIEVGDMDNDGKLGLKDVIILLRTYLGIN